jgi:hypothetical protein
MVQKRKKATLTPAEVRAWLIGEADELQGLPQSTFWQYPNLWAAYRGGRWAIRRERIRAKYSPQKQDELA